MMTATTQPQPQPDMLMEAMSLADLGFRVIPVPPGEKHPPFKEWQNVATSDADSIRRWWNGLYRNHGIGIATGPGFFVLDVDVAFDKEGRKKTGDETLYELEQVHGELPDTVESITGSGGRHLFFKLPEGIEIRNDQSGCLGVDLDIRGTGGQVIAPPSLHASGRRYSWLDGHAPDQVQVAYPPQWIIDILTAPPVYKERAPRDPSDPLSADGPAKRFNDRTTWDELLSKDGWTFHHTDRTGEHYWTRPGKPRRDGASATVGWDGRDVLKVFTSSIPWLPERNPTRGQTAYNRFQYHCARHHGHDESAGAKALLALEPQLPKPSIGEAIKAIQDAEQASRVEEPSALAEAINKEENKPSLLALMRARLYRGNEVENIPPRDPLIEGMLDMGVLAVTYGPPKSAKSFLTLDKACHIALGMDYLGCKVTKGPVLYLLAEGVGGFRKRYDAWKRRHGVENVEDMYLLSYPIKLLEETDLHTLLALIDGLEQKPIYVAFDTLARVIAGNEEGVKEMGMLVQAADKIRDHLGCTVEFVHHSGKDVARGARGGSSLLGALDSEFKVTREANRITMMSSNQRDHEQDVSWTFDLVPSGDSVVVVYTGESTTTPSKATAKERDGKPVYVMKQISEYLASCGDVGVRQSSLLSQLRARKATILDALAHLENEGYLRKVIEPTTKRGAPSYYYHHVSLFDGVLRVSGEFSSNQFQSVPISSGNQLHPGTEFSSPLDSLGGTEFGNRNQEPKDGEFSSQPVAASSAPNGVAESPVSTTPTVVVDATDDPFLQAADEYDAARRAEARQ